MKKNIKKNTPVKKVKETVKLNDKQLVDVKLDDVGREAEYYIRKKDELTGAKEAFNKSEQDLIAALSLANRNSIDIDGKTLSISHIDSKDKIKSELTNKGVGKRRTFRRKI